MNENEKNEPLRIGNFLVCEMEEDKRKYVKINALSGFWEVRYRDDNGMYGFIKILMEEEKLRDYLESFVTTLYTIMHCTPDLQFFDEYYRSYNSLNDRTLARKDKVSDEEDKKTLDDIKLGEELKEAIKAEETAERN